jgi:hypothetical protein
MAFTNRNITFFCVMVESDEPRILKGGFRPIKMCDVNKCFLRSNPIFCIRLSKNLQAYTGEPGDFKYKNLSRNMKNSTYSATNSDFLSAERDKHDIGLSGFELRQDRVRQWEGGI